MQSVGRRMRAQQRRSSVVRSARPARHVALVVLGAVLLLGDPAMAAAPTLGRVDAAAVVTPDAGARPEPSSCPAWVLHIPGATTSATLNEVSGIAGSHAISDHWWVHNDSGDSARAFLVDESLAIVAEVALDGVTTLDVEDIAIGPDATVWLADVGDNLRIRPEVQLYGFAERTTSATVAVRTVRITFADRRRDVETLMIDPRSGDGFLVEKRNAGGRSGVFRIPAGVLASGGSVVAEEVVAIDTSTGGAVGPTGGDISPDGSTIVIKTFTTTYLWPRGRGAAVGDTLAASPLAPCRVADGGTNEAIGFDRDGRRLAALSEGAGSRLRLLAEQW